MRQDAWRFGLRTIVGLVAILDVACTETAPAPPPFQPVAEVKQLMQSVVEPNAWVLWNNTGSIVTATETIERRPKDDEEWEAVRNSAVTLTEAGNLLMMPPRARDNGEWMRRAQALVEIGHAAWKAADARDVDGLFTIGGDMYEACLRCHQSYGHANKHAPK